MARKELNPLFFPSNEDFHKTGWIPILAPTKNTEVLQAYNHFDICSCATYSKDLQRLDYFIGEYIRKITITTMQLDKSSSPIYFKHLHNDTEKYRKWTKGEISHKMLSYHYLSGLYDFLLESNAFSPLLQPFQAFLETLDRITKSVSISLSSILEKIGKKTPISISVKIWKHSYTNANSLLLPLHSDRSIFTLLLHKKNCQKNGLRLYSNTLQKEEEIHIEETPFSVPSIQNDYKPLFPGIACSELFNIFPSFHCVIGKKTKTTCQRQSLIYFIGKAF